MRDQATELGILFKLLEGKPKFGLASSGIRIGCPRLSLKIQGGYGVPLLGQQNAQERQMSHSPSRHCPRAPQAHPQRRQHEVLSLHTSAGRRKYLDAAERARFIGAAQSSSLRLRALCLTLAFTGCRVSEALALGPDALRRDEGVIALRSLKKRSQAVVVREVPVPRELLDELVELAGSQQRQGHDRLWLWGRVRAWQLVKAVMRMAGIVSGPHQTAKGLRHAFGLHAVRSGVPINFVQRWLGHASMSTTAIYLQAIGPEERAIAARMWAT